jgi:hypothetical protein
MNHYDGDDVPDAEWRRLEKHWRRVVRNSYISVSRGGRWSVERESRGDGDGYEPGGSRFDTVVVYLVPMFGSVSEGREIGAWRLAELDPLR